MSENTVGALGSPYIEADWPHGLRCAACQHLFQEGERFSERLHAFQDDIPILLIVCISCALKEER